MKKTLFMFHVFVFHVSLCLLHDPDIPELHRHAMFLEHERPGWRLAESAGGAMGGVELLVFVDRHAIQQNRRLGVGGLLSAAVETWGGKIDVERLPHQWWQRCSSAGK